MENIAFPTSIPVKQILVTSPDYPGNIERNYALYEGGDAFNAEMRDKYLRKRPIEISAHPYGRTLRQARLQSANYENILAGLVDWIIASALQSPPQIVAAPPIDPEAQKPQPPKPDAPPQPKPAPKPIEPALQAKLNYWNSLNDNIGDGDLATLARARLKEALLTGRSYLSINFPASDSDSPDLDGQKKLGELDATVCGLDASDIDNWDEAEGWYRTHSVDKVSSAPWLPPTVEQHLWTYITADGIYEYAASRPIKDDGTTDPWPDDAKAILDPEKVAEHSLGVNPVIPLNIDFCLVDRLSEIVLAHWNRTSDLSYYLAAISTAQMVLRLTNIPTDANGKAKPNIVADESNAIVLKDKDDDAKFISPQNGADGPLKSDVDRLDRQLRAALLAMGLQIGPGNQSRQSGVAKLRDISALYQLVSGLADALRSALLQALKAIQRARGEEDTISITLRGLDQFDILELDQKINSTTAFLALPGVPPSARKYLVGDIALDLCSQADESVRNRISQEIADGIAEAPLQPPNPFGKPDGKDDEKDEDEKETGDENEKE